MLEVTNNMLEPENVRILLFTLCIPLILHPNTFERRAVDMLFWHRIRAKESVESFASSAFTIIQSAPTRNDFYVIKLECAVGNFKHTKVNEKNRTFKIGMWWCLQIIETFTLQQLTPKVQSASETTVGIMLINALDVFNNRIVRVKGRFYNWDHNNNTLLHYKPFVILASCMLIIIPFLH